MKANNTETHSTVFADRATKIDYSKVRDLYYLGNYKRRIAVSLNRMMENAYDWEHLPYVHAGTFHHIRIVEEGDWGWRAEVSSAKSKGKEVSLLELLVDVEKNYWATTVVSGEGQGIEIHTQATQVGDDQIEVDVRFYSPEHVNWLKKVLGHRFLRRQYQALYDEDEALMQGRQTAIDNQFKWRRNLPVKEERLLVGEEPSLNKNTTHVVNSKTGRFCVVFNQEKWRAYSAVCPHLLGNLDQASVREDGQVQCPWHGYHFDILSGKNKEDKCGRLPIYETKVVNGKLYVVLS